jgi:hypothetical protein
MNQLLTHESKSIDTAMQSLKKANNWLSSFIESYSPPLDGDVMQFVENNVKEFKKENVEHYLTRIHQKFK